MLSDIVSMFETLPGKIIIHEIKIATNIIIMIFLLLIVTAICWNTSIF